MKTPYFLVDEKKVRENAQILASVMEKTGCRILLAQKAFSMFSMYPMLRKYLAGTAASGLYEAKLGHEEFGGETHVFSAAYRPDEFEEIAEIADHIVFNSPNQLLKYAPIAKAHGKQVGLRLNPECSTQEGHEIYDPCAPGSRLGTTNAQFDRSLVPMLDGVHMHTLCEQNSDALEQTVAALEEKFSDVLHAVKWVNLGGGHHITRPDYDIDRLVRIIEHVRDTYNVQVYLEPGEAVVLNAGVLKTTVLDLIENNGVQIAILDTSAACHMPDVIEMPYRPPLIGAGEPNEKKYTYRLGGPTCLSGDVIGDYSFDAPLSVGDVLTFGDMALYTMVKTNTFNGMMLPSIAMLKEDGEIACIKTFGYEDFKNRLS